MAAASDTEIARSAHGAQLGIGPTIAPVETGEERVMTEDHAGAGADSTPGMSAAPSAPLPDGQATSAGQEQTHVGPRTADSPASDAEAAPALLPLQSPNKPQKEWRGDWQIAVVVAVLVLGGFLTLWLLQHANRSIALPGMLLGLSKETSPSAQALADKIVSRTQAAAGDVMSYPA